MAILLGATGRCCIFLLLICRNTHSQRKAKFQNTQNGPVVQVELVFTASTGSKMAVQFMFLLSRQGKVRLTKWYQTISQKEKARIMRELSTLILSRRAKMCNVLEYKDIKIVYRRYASLFFIMGIDQGDNELLALEIIHRFVEQMDKIYGNVCELDIIFGFDKAYHILDELLIDGYVQESSKKEVLRKVAQQDELENMDEFDNILA